MTLADEQEALRILGLSDRVHWLSHFVWQLLFLLLSSLLMAAILVGGKVLEHSTYGFTLLFFIVFGTVTIIFCFALTTFFSTANVAAAMGGLLYFLLYVPYLFVSRPDKFAALTRSDKLGLCLFPQTCMGIGTFMWATNEGSNIGFSISNMATPVTGADV